MILVRLDEHITYITVLLHGPPEGGTLPLDRDTDFVEMPGIAEAAVAIPQLFGKGWTKFYRSLTHGFVTERLPALR